MHTCADLLTISELIELCSATTLVGFVGLTVLIIIWHTGPELKTRMNIYKTRAELFFKKFNILKIWIFSWFCAENSYIDENNILMMWKTTLFNSEFSLTFSLITPVLDFRMHTFLKNSYFGRFQAIYLDFSVIIKWKNDKRRFTNQIYMGSGPKITISKIGICVYVNQER